MLIVTLHWVIGPAGHPRNVKAVSLSSTEIKVTWEDVPLIDRNGIITMYEVKYTPLENFDGAIGTATTNVSAVAVVVTELEEYVNYNISVRAYSRVGPGPYSDQVTALTYEDGKYC